MPLQFYGDGKLSEVWIEDQRPDGSAVMLVCRSEDVDRPGGGAVEGPSVNLIASSAPDGNAYPLLRELGLVVRVQKLHVDTTNMPGGIQRYVNSLFGRKATEVAERGVRLVAITPATAREWGWIAPDDESAARYGDAVSGRPPDGGTPADHAPKGQQAATTRQAKLGRPAGP